MMSSTLGAGAAAIIHATVYRLTHNSFAGTRGPMRWMEGSHVRVNSAYLLKSHE
jgi:hypothetical protein